MSNLAQNQLDFQVYNQQLNGPRSPIDMDTLKDNADAEQTKQAALGKVFDATSSSYVERDEIYEAGKNHPTPVMPSKEVAKNRMPAVELSDSLGKRKQGPVDFTRSTYEVYTNTPVAGAWGDKTTRVVYMGREHYSCAKNARDVADLLRAKGMETFVFRCNRTVVKNRKRVKGPPHTKKPAAHKQKLKSLNDFGARGFSGDWQIMPDGINAKGKQKIWFVHKNLTFSRDTAAEDIRSAAICIKQCRAEEAVKWVEDSVNMLYEFIEELPFHCNGETDKSKVRQMTLRIRNVIKRIDPKPIDTMPAVPVSDASLPAIVTQ
jgi:hypothetical protein